MVRPRGFHLPERHCLVDGRPAPGMLFDFGLLPLPQRGGAGAGRDRSRTSTCRRCRATSRRGSGTTSSSTRRRALKIPAGTIKATVLIETLPAAFEMDEILFELKEHIAGLNCGRWDYIFSSIKTLQDRPVVRAARSRPGDDGGAVPARRTRSCSSRPATAAARFAMGGMAAQIPIKDDPEANDARDGQGPRRQAARGAAKATTAPGWRIRRWSAMAKEVFDEGMPGPNQLRSSSRGRRRQRGGAARAADRHAHRRPGSVTTSASASSISRRGSAARARCRSTT